MYTFMFLLASLLPAMFLRCSAQELLRMAIFVSDGFEDATAFNGLFDGAMTFDD